MIDFNNLFKSFESKKVLIIGDIMIDSYMWGISNRMSPEAPVPIVEIEKYEKKLGGAGNVALNIKSLGGEPILCSVIGKDYDGKLIKEFLEEKNISSKGILIEKERKTTIKTRIIANNKHQIRIDEEETSSIKIEEDLIKLIKNIIQDADVVILEDYNKGVLTENVIKKAIEYANNNNTPTIVDPKINNFKHYKGCTIFKPNLKEIVNGMNIDIDENSQESLKKVTEITRKELNTKGLLLTLSSNGICINTEKYFQHTPAFKRDIIDVSGAGDTVVSVAAMCLTSNIEHSILAQLSNLAGGIVCEDVGVVPINKRKLLSEAIKHIN